MSITLRPEHEKAIAQAIESGAYGKSAQVIEPALEFLHSEDEWLVDNKGAINEKIEPAMTQLDRGEGVSGEGLRDRLEKRKDAWLTEQKR
jgi:Arc/MetJ-type ribon-helix-helix transcriptional regulator